MRRRVGPSKGPAAIPAAVSLAGLSVAANGKSARDHKNPNIPTFIPPPSTTAAAGRGGRQAFAGGKSLHR